MVELEVDIEEEQEKQGCAAGCGSDPTCSCRIRMENLALPSCWAWLNGPKHVQKVTNMASGGNEKPAGMLVSLVYIEQPRQGLLHRTRDDQPHSTSDIPFDLELDHPPWR